MSITYETLNEQISKIKGTTFGGIDTLTEVKLKGGKKNPHQGRVTKLTEGANVILFADTTVNAYEQMVRRQIDREGKLQEDFVVKPRAWGTRINNSPFIEHKGKYYLECFFRSPGKSTYFLDGEVIDKSEIEGLEDKPEREPTEAEKTAQGGVENKVIVRTYSLDSIKAIRINNEELLK